MDFDAGWLAESLADYLGGFGTPVLGGGHKIVDVRADPHEDALSIRVETPKGLRWYRLEVRRGMRGRKEV